MGAKPTDRKKSSAPLGHRRGGGLELGRLRSEPLATALRAQLHDSGGSEDSETGEREGGKCLAFERGRGRAW